MTLVRYGWKRTPWVEVLLNHSVLQEMGVDIQYSARDGQQASQKDEMLRSGLTAKRRRKCTMVSIWTKIVDP